MHRKLLKIPSLISDDDYCCFPMLAAVRQIAFLYEDELTKEVKIASGVWARTHAFVNTKDESVGSRA
jgi:hypothetical protein